MQDYSSDVLPHPRSSTPGIERDGAMTRFSPRFSPAVRGPRSRGGMALLLGGVLLATGHLTAQSLTPEETANIEKDTSRHFGDAQSCRLAAGALAALL